MGWVGGKQGWRWSASISYDQHTHSRFPPRTPPHSYGAPGDRSEGLTVLAARRQASSFLVAGLDLGNGLGRVFKVRLWICYGKWKGVIPARERPLSG